MENEFAVFWLEGGILYFNYKIQVSLNISATDKVFKDIELYLHGEKYACLCDISGITSVDKSARDYIAYESSKLFTRVAFLSTNTISMVIGKLFLAVNKPTIPIRIFRDSETAIQYLMSIEK